ncbi:MAG: endolytic transglycosylase MltG [Pseudomonadota bacterium]
MGKAFLVAVFSLLVIVAAAVWSSDVWFRTGHWPWNAQPSSTADAPAIPVEVSPGSSLAGIAQQLAAEGLLEFPRLWRVMVEVHGQAGALQAGDYVLPANATPAELMALLVEGAVRSYRLAIIEGTTVRSVLDALRAAPGVTQTLSGDDPEAELLKALELEGSSLEGWLFPDTYVYRSGETDRALIQQAVQRMRSALEAAWRSRRRELPYRTRYELLTMASIVEKESALASDRAQIAQVFVTRLAQGMRLQTDPTVIYGLGSAFDGDLRRSDLTADTPYNTYTRHGLPPTPIALPGLAALTAASQPAEGDYLYFVARGDGSSQFSRTLAEHNAAVRRYQLNSK